MLAIKFFVNRVRCDQLRSCYLSVLCQQMQQRSYVTKRLVVKTEPVTPEPIGNDDGHYWPRKIFSGIQPTGELHLGNYLGAVRKWTKLQETREDVSFCIVDMHSITIPQDPATLREQIFKMAATMLACGIDPNQSTLFVQSSVKEHSELCWLLGTLTTMARLGHLPQYKEKTRQMKEIPLGLFVYPVLQAADIMLYKATHVPVGEDQVQHIQLTQHLSRTFNTRFGRTFPICTAMIDNKQVSRIRSLRDPTKKMSKSDPDLKSAIYVSDEPEMIVEKIKKAVTDFCSDVSYEPETRLGVSNLIAIHSHMSGQPIEKIIDEARTLDTGKYKLRVADAIVEHLKPIREKIQLHMEDRSELVTLLDNGTEKARNIACDTIEEVKQKMGLGAPYLPLFMDLKRSYSGGSSSSSGSMSGVGGGSNSGNNSGASNSGAGSSSSSNNSGVGGGAINDIENEPLQLPRQNMSPVAMATAAVNAVTGNCTSIPQMMSTMSSCYARSSSAAMAAATTSTIKQQQQQNISGISHSMLEAKIATLEPTRKLSAVQKPVVPRQQIRVEKKNSIRTHFMNCKSKTQSYESLGDELLSLSLLQRRQAPPPPAPSPLQALLPQYQQQYQEKQQQLESEQALLEFEQQQQQQQQQQQSQQLEERKSRRIIGNSDSNQNSMNINEKKSLSSSTTTSALTIAQPIQTNLETTSSKPKKFSTKPIHPVALTENVPAAVSPIAEVKAALNAEISINSTLNTISTRQQQQQIVTRRFATLPNPPACLFSTTSLNSASASSSSSQSFYSTQKQKPDTSKKQTFIKLIIFGSLAIGAGFSGIYYFWRKVLQAFFDSKRNS